jgi:DNA helicase-2/ATP-dependent DNA helicase PcrA
MIEWTKESTELMGCPGHALVLGGPGCGKTTMALLKAGQEIANKRLKSRQRILFLSFARATISRIEQHAKTLLSAENRGELEINTYHGFTWGLIRSHGYLLTSGRPIRLLPPPQGASALATIAGEPAKNAEKQRLFTDEGLLHFDLFAKSAADLLRRSNNVRALVCSVYPIIILDEFQDTNTDEWNLIQQLGTKSTLIALADPDQRIYEFRGASPTRIPDFIKAFDPKQFDLSASNHRSTGTDICVYGNDLLKGANKGKTYQQVRIQEYRFRKGNGLHLELKIAAWNRRKVLIDAGVVDWSLAILVPTKSLMLEASQYLDAVQTFETGKKAPQVKHEVAIETAGPALAAVVIAGVLSGGSAATDIAQRLILELCQHMKGRKGNDGPSQQQLVLAECLNSYVQTGVIKGSKRKALAQACLKIGEARMQLKLSGEPEQDWLKMRELFANAATAELEMIAHDARFLKFLHKGATLRARLAELWRSTGGYGGAVQAVQDALVQEHFSSSSQEFRGIHVMTIHKSKGKEFDEVIIYEGAYQSRILRTNSTDREKAQALLSLRVGVTRAKKFTTILTPKQDPCPFL